MALFDNSGPALDPATAGLLAAGFSALQNSGPSAMPRSFGQIAGGAGQAGLGAYQNTLQSNTLLGIEKLKADMLKAQVNSALRQNAVQEGVLQNLGILPPGFQPGQMGGIGGGSGMGGGSGGMPGAAPQAIAPQAPAAPSAGPLSTLPPYARTAVGMDVALNGGKGMGPILTKALGPQEIQGVGAVQFNPATGNYDALPGLAGAMAQWKQAQLGVENANTLTEVPLANGQTQKMTKAQELSLVNGTAHIKNVMPWATPDLVTSIQRQMVDEPDKPVSMNISVAGREPVKLELPSLSGIQSPAGNGMPGITVGQSTAGRAAAEASGKNAGDVQSQIDTEATSALQSRKILGEMRVLSQDFTQGKMAPYKRALGEYAQALNLPGDWSKEIKGAESQQALQKLTAQMATAAMKQFTNRGTQMEFNTFLKNNPNAELTPGGFQKVLDFMDQTAGQTLAKQQAYVEWRKSNPLEKSQDFLAEWNKSQAAAIESPKAAFPTPPQAAVARLRMNPKEAAQFNEIFGPGAAEKALGR